MFVLNGITWYRVEYKLPDQGQIVMLTGDGGGVTLEKSRFLVLGYYDEQFRPRLSPKGPPRWLNIHDDALMDHGYEPTHWAMPIPLPVK